MFAAGLVLSSLWTVFSAPSQESKPWTYWFWSNSLTDRETMSEELADIAQLGFGGECDQLAFLAANDVPQGEFWPCEEKGLDGSGHAVRYMRTLDRAIASAAHIYDLPIAAAEAFTHMNRHWSVDPAFLKPIGDQAFANGINRMVWHTYTTSPRKYGCPGLEYFAGSHINRNVTWHDDFAPMVFSGYSSYDELQPSGLLGPMCLKMKGNSR